MDSLGDSGSGELHFSNSLIHIKILGILGTHEHNESGGEGLMESNPSSLK